MGELWGAYREVLSEDWLCYISTALYLQACPYAHDTGLKHVHDWGTEPCDGRVSGTIHLLQTLVKLFECWVDCEIKVVIFNHQV